ncbi:unnamed protein product [Phytophthora fragariaefolia]|uniref:Calmodulin-lysine N-methyltransferase n=1 Tax=Phytophthora fragariaefolia TaxID=1490495 RepID=A0A9W7D4X9_9STRA|nr:unnamed protein product [Phytophthora fragariaefolia]
MAPDKTRRHWLVLRDALRRSTSGSEQLRATASSIAAEFFPVFAASAPDATQLQLQPALEDFAWVAYDLSPATHAQPTRVFVHEKRKDVKRVSIAELLSHQVNQGVDNTGNIRTWPSEQILLSYLLQSGVCSRVQRRDVGGELLPIACCELGSGMAGLASLGLLARPPVALQRVVVTDGNPQSVKNLQLCVEENRKQRVFPAHGQDPAVTAELLRWDRDVALREDLQHQFDLVFASDCLFFEEFHEDLAHTIKRLLRPGSGRCLLLQPSRNGSMERFSAVATRLGLHVLESRAYDPEIQRQHAAYERDRADYVPDVHLPVLLTVSHTPN